ncbi:AfsR/SARP family transcriptional regulator [Amycolatopsis vastitatis]|uniref:AfsR/SARP family transcriptional regulator n=1 Tax=Amycolatopsis vastitatis TaxID=1905142 RepID=UPI001304437A|nr:BTAD domain-containing putative transcriptional regulator [Amycolatopsis vastitatis]
MAGTTGVLRPSAGKHRVLLAGLLLRANRSATVDELLGWLWDRVPPATARQTLYVYLNRLRGELAQVADDQIRIRTVSGGGGYLLEIDPESVDVLAFRRLVETSHEAQLNGDPAAAVAMLTDAEHLWRGPALADVPSDRLQRDEAARLTDEWGRAVERRVDLQLAFGRHSELIAELRSLTARYPLRERFWAQLMLALYRDGRQAESLESYQRARDLLVEEVGLDPGDELRRLHHQVLTGAVPPPMWASDTTDAIPQVGAPWAPQRQLPPDIPDFVGRVAEVEEMTSLLRSAAYSPTVPLVVVSGPAGVGKSALAVRVAHLLADTFPDGQWYARLSQANSRVDPADLIDDLLRLSGLHPRSVPDGLNAKTAALRARLAGRRVLLLLDDALDTDQVLPILPGTAGCAMLVTSRRLLTSLPGVQPIKLDMLLPSDARELLANLVGGDRVAEERQAAEEIVSLCGQLPLALRIAGSRLGSKPAARLDVFAQTLRDGQRRLDQLELDSLRVRASMALSYLGLNDGARQAFRLLGLLDGGDFPAWLVTVLLPTADGEQVIEQLIGSSLITSVGRDPTGEPRYRMHDLLAVYAAELAGEVDEHERMEALSRVLSALIQLASAAWRRGRRTTWGWLPEEVSPVTQVLTDRHMNRLVGTHLTWEQTERRLVLFMIARGCEIGRYADAARLANLFCVSSYHDYLWIQDVVCQAALDAGDELVRWRTEFARARHLVHHHTSHAVRGLTSCLHHFERLGSVRETCHVMVWLSLCHTLLEDHTNAEVFAQRALAAAKSVGLEDRQLQAMALPELARSLAMADRYPEAAQAFEQAWQVAQEIGDPASLWTVLNRLGDVARRAGDLDRAQWAAETGLAMASIETEPQASGWMMCLLARVHVAKGAIDLAVELADRAREQFIAAGEEGGIAAVDAIRAEAHLAEGRPQVAVPLLRAALPALKGEEHSLVGEIQVLLDMAEREAG